MRFLDREEAGIHLARALAPHAGPDGLVMALPRGGVPVGWQVARLLALPLEVIAACKVRIPGALDMALGAVAEGGVRHVNLGMAGALGIDSEALSAAIRRAEDEVGHLVQLYRAGRSLPVVAGRPVILVDEFITTGSKMRVAMEVLRAHGAWKVVVAAPVAAAPIAGRLAGLADAVVALVQPATVLGVEQWYQEARHVTDAEVVDILARPRYAPDAELAI
ncbi:MAG TPA: phosphoribosyltransferase family protein [Anaeromyxobacteraceae bacterium]|nr:phosphoribosyltransferase family protein [Anaeromyxobacteraceae bacterium]